MAIETTMGAFNLNASAGVSLPSVPQVPSVPTQPTIVSATLGPTASRVISRYASTFSTSRVGAGAAGTYSTPRTVSHFAPLPGGSSPAPDAAYPGPVEQLVSLPATLVGNVARKAGVSPLLIALGAIAAVGAAYAVTR